MSLATQSRPHAAPAVLVDASTVSDSEHDELERSGSLLR